MRVGALRLADDGTAQVAMGLVGHGTLQRLDLNENAIGEYGAAAIARALLRNGVLTHISLAANRIDAKGCEHLSEPVRLSGTLLHLELNDNPRMGSLGAWWLGEALAGGSGELRDQVASERAAKKRGEDPNGGALTLKTLAIAGVGSDEESEGEQNKDYQGGSNRHPQRSCAWAPRSRPRPCRPSLEPRKRPPVCGRGVWNTSGWVTVN